MIDAHFHALVHFRQTCGLWDLRDIYLASRIPPYHSFDLRLPSLVITQSRALSIFESTRQSHRHKPRQNLDRKLPHQHLPYQTQHIATTITHSLTSSIPRNGSQTPRLSSNQRKRHSSLTASAPIESQAPEQSSGESVFGHHVECFGVLGVEWAGCQGLFGFGAAVEGLYG